jgi:hypothetical protein
VDADRKLANYRQISSYLKAVAVASDRVEIQVLGKTTLGEEMIMAVTTPENLRNHAQKANQLLNDANKERCRPRSYRFL